MTYNTVGHCFFLEDGIEHGNEFVHNLAIQTKCHTSKPAFRPTLPVPARPDTERTASNPRDVLLPSDNTVASYWITNPDNTYRDNVAAGSDSNGFWMSLAEHPNGAFLDTDISKNTWPRRTPFREFKGNVSHSNYDAFMFDRNLNPNNTFTVTGSSHTGLENPADANSKALASVFENLTAYKNRNGAIWGRGEMHVFRNVKAADNAIGFTHASGAFGRYEFTSRVVDSLFVGETENIGTPKTDAEKAAGRSLPKPELPDFPIRGYEYYDYRHDVVNTTFRNYEDNATRKTGAISNLLFSSFGVSTNNSFEHVKFENAKPVYFPPMAGNAKWASDNGGSSSYKTAAYRDKDGSLGLGPQFLRYPQRRRERQHRSRHSGLRDQAHLECGGVQRRRRAHDYRGCRRRRSWRWVPVLVGQAQRLVALAVPVRLQEAPAAAGPGGPGAAAGPGMAVGRAGGPGAGPGAPGGRAGGAGAAPAQPPIVLSRNGKEYTATSGNVRAGYRDQGEHRTAEPESLRDGAGQGLLGDLRTAGVHHRSLGCGAVQPGRAAQGQRHLVLQGQWLALGQACLPR